MNYKIRLATISDSHTLAPLKQKVWETTYRGIYPDEKLDNYNIEEQTNKFKKIIENEKINLYVVEVNNSIVGYMSCGEPMRPFQDYEQEIGLLYIMKEHQGNGIGKKLFLMAYEDIKKKGYHKFFISCNKYNKNAQKFYEAMGGKVVEVDDDFDDKSCPQIKYHYDVIS